MPAPARANVGSFCLVRQPYPKSRWSNPAVPEYAPNWIVSLWMPGAKAPQKRSSQHEICAPCMKAIKPNEERPDCRCRRPANEFAGNWLKTERERWTGERTERIQGARRPKDTVMLSAVFDLYKEHGPQEREKEAREARYLLEQATGTRFEDMTLDLLLDRPRELILKWAAMRQAYAERGWSMRGETRPPADAWAQLRADWAAGTIRKTPDRDTVRPVNTTITSHLRSLKQIFSKTSRTNYLPGLDLPPTPKLAEVVLALPCRRGFCMIAPETYRLMHEGMEKLKADDFTLWTALQLQGSVGVRTKELMAIKPHWLERTGGETFVVLKNRPEEGFYLKARHRAVTRRIRLPQHVVQALDSIRTETSIFGQTPWKTEDMVKRGSDWLRRYIPTGPHTWYWLRKLAGAIKYTAGETKDAGSLLGHAPGSTVTAGTYIDLLEPVDGITLDQLHPDRLQLARAAVA